MRFACSSVIVAAVAALFTACPTKRSAIQSPDLDAQLALPPPSMPQKPTGTLEDDAARLHVIDIGQGLAVLVEFPCGALLYDTGGEQNDTYDGVPALITYLERFFERRSDLNGKIDVLAISHPHIDHTRGISAVLERFEVQNVVDNGASVDDLGGAPQLELQRWVAAQNDRVPYVGVKRGDIKSRSGLVSDAIDPIGGCARAKTDPVITALWGGSDLAPELGHNANDDSVVLRVDYGKTSFLLAGDLEIIGWAKMTKKLGKTNPVFDVDVYVVGHHGSKNATVPYQVELMSPKVAVISAGPYSRYLGSEEEYTAHVFAHPNAKALEPLQSDRGGVSMWRAKPIKAWVGLSGRWKDRLAQWEQRVIRRAIYATSWDGTVVVSGNSNGFLSVDVEIPESRWVPQLSPPATADKGR